MTKRSGEDFISQEPFQASAEIWERKREKASSQSYFYALLFLQLSSKQTKNRSCWRTSRTKTCSCSSRCSFAIPKVQNRGEFPVTPGLNETLSPPTNTPDPSLHSKETQAVREPWYVPASIANVGGWVARTAWHTRGHLCPAASVWQFRVHENHPVWEFLLHSQAFLQDILQEDQLLWVTSAVFGYHLLATAGLSLKSASISVKGSFIRIKKPEFGGRRMGKQSLERTPATMQQTLLFSTRQRVVSSAGSS